MMSTAKKNEPVCQINYASLVATPSFEKRDGRKKKSEPTIIDSQIDRAKGVFQFKRNIKRLNGMLIPQVCHFRKSSSLYRCYSTEPLPRILAPLEMLLRSSASCNGTSG